MRDLAPAEARRPRRSRIRAPTRAPRSPASARTRHQDANNVDSAGFRGDTISMLYCVANVEGSETLFAHCATLWSRLSDEQREFLETHEAVHSNRSTAGGPAAVDSAFGLRMNASGTLRIRDASRRRRCASPPLKRRCAAAVRSRARGSRAVPASTP